MDDLLDLIRAKGNVRNGVDGRFYVSVRYRDEDTTMVSPLADRDLKRAVLQWCSDNCTGEFETYGNGTMVFADQDEAILFLLRMRR